MIDISIVIPTRNRWSVLSRTLDAIERQRLDGLRVEVVVVDNGSTDGSAEELESAAASGDRAYELRALREPVAGAAAARNCGLSGARGEVILFLGDDTIPADEGLVAGHAAVHREGDEFTGVVGHTEWDAGIETTPVMSW